MRKTYYNICQNCGAHLDPGEVCDCEKEQPEAGPYQCSTNRQTSTEKGIKKECPNLPQLKHTEEIHKNTSFNLF